MKPITVIVLLVALFTAQNATAGTTVEHIDGDLYFATYQLNRMMAGSGVSLMYTKKKGNKKIDNQLHKICLKEGFGYLHEVTTAEIAADDLLTRYFEMFAGGEMSTQARSGKNNLRHNVTKRFVRFSSEQQADFERCEKK